MDTSIHRRLSKGPCLLSWLVLTLLLAALPLHSSAQSKSIRIELFSVPLGYNNKFSCCCFFFVFSLIYLVNMNILAMKAATSSLFLILGTCALQRVQ